MRLLSRWGVALAVVLCLSLSVSAQDVTKARQLLEQALDALKPPAPDVSTVIATADALTAALAGTDPVLTLSPTLVYPNSLTIRRSVTLQSTVPAGRMTREPALPRFGGGLTIAADNVTITGVEVRHTNPLTDIVVISGAHVTLDRVRVLGDPVKGAKRCLAANANGDVKILRVYAADCFQASPGNDSQALAAWDMAPGLLVDDSYLEGGSETILFGGADSPEDRTPTDIIVRHSTITKNPAWMGQPIGVKNLVELKNAKKVRFENNVGSYSWTQGQTGCLLTLTVRNQDGRAPWATIQDVTFQNNRWSDGAGAIALLGRDDIKETRTGRPVPIGTIRQSVPMRNVTISGDTFALDPLKYGKGSTTVKIILIGGGPTDVTLQNVVITAASKAGSAVSFSASPFQATGLKLLNVTFPATRYGIFGDATTAAASNFTATNPAWTKYTSGSTLSAITVTP